MKKELQDIVLGNRVFLRDHVRLQDGMYDHLIEKGVLLQCQAERIQLGRINAAQVSVLLDDLKMNDDNAFWLFLEALTESGQDGIAQRLKNKAKSMQLPVVPDQVDPDEQLQERHKMIFEKHKGTEPKGELLGACALPNPPFTAPGSSTDIGVNLREAPLQDDLKIQQQSTGKLLGACSTSVFPPHVPPKDTCADNPEISIQGDAEIRLESRDKSRGAEAPPAPPPLAPAPKKKKKKKKRN